MARKGKLLMWCPGRRPCRGTMSTFFPRQRPQHVHGCLKGPKSTSGSAGHSCSFTAAQNTVNRVRLAQRPQPGLIKQKGLTAPISTEQVHLVCSRAFWERCSSSSRARCESNAPQTSRRRASISRSQGSKCCVSSSHVEDRGQLSFQEEATRR